MPTKTPREIENKLEEIKYNFLNYNWVHTKEYMYDFLVTKPMLALLEEARQEEREKLATFIRENRNTVTLVQIEDFISSLIHYGNIGL